MKKLLGILVLVIMFCNLALPQSSLPECEGNDRDISEFSYKHFMMVKKWTNCQGTGLGPKGEKYVGEFYKGKFHGQGIFTKNGRKYIRVKGVRWYTNLDTHGNLNGELCC